jgi:hypothetical protein
MGQKHPHPEPPKPEEPVECPTLEPYERMFLYLRTLGTTLSASTKLDEYTLLGDNGTLDAIVAAYLGDAVSTTAEDNRYWSVVGESNGGIADLSEVCKTIIIKKSVEVVNVPWYASIDGKDIRPTVSVSYVGIGFDENNRLSRWPSYINVISGENKTMQLELKEALKLSIAVTIIESIALCGAAPCLREETQEGERLLVVYHDTVTDAIKCYALRDARLWCAKYIAPGRDYGLSRHMKKLAAKNETLCTVKKEKAKTDARSYLSAIQ